jgi:hypothetical protein
MTTINKTYTELQRPLTIVAELKTILFVLFTLCVLCFDCHSTLSADKQVHMRLLTTEKSPKTNYKGKTKTTFFTVQSGAP